MTLIIRQVRDLEPWRVIYKTVKRENEYISINVCIHIHIFLNIMSSTSLVWCTTPAYEYVIYYNLQLIHLYNSLSDDYCSDFVKTFSLGDKKYVLIINR